MNIEFQEKIPFFKFSNEREIPMIGFQVSKDNMEPLELYNLLKLAIKHGYRHFDTGFIKCFK